LSIRFKEANNWGSWSAITAGKAEALTSGDKTVSGALTATSFIGNGAGLTNLPLSSYSTTSINDTKYLKLDGTNSMALNSSIALTGTGKFSGDGSLLTNLNYNSFTNPPDLTLYNGWTKSGNDIYNTLQSGKVGIGLTNPTGKLEFNYNYPSGTFTNFYLKFGHETKYALIAFFVITIIDFIHHIQELMK
jgi:hypothetical protein